MHHFMHLPHPIQTLTQPTMLTDLESSGPWHIQGKVSLGTPVSFYNHKTEV